MPAEYSSKRFNYTEKKYPMDRVPRLYYVSFELFGTVQADEGVGIFGRPNAFTVAVYESDNPDSVVEVWLDSIYAQDDVVEFRRAEKYGGITEDLYDPVIIPF